MSEMPLAVGLQGPDPLAIARALRELGPWKETPTEVDVDIRSRKVSDDWLEAWAPRAADSVVATFGADDRYRVYKPGAIVLAGCAAPRDPAAVLDLLSGVPFELASFGTLHPEWRAGAEPYYAPSFGDQHFPHGWGCAFRGEGHARLVSRRWLEYGPWRLHRAPDDLSLVQFHELDADAATALEQARPGHRRMGITDEGGFLQSGYLFAHEVRGVYEPAEQLLKVVVHGRTVPQREMLDACALRHYRTLGPERPVEQVAYVFVEERNARAHLHELWLRELECRALVDGLEIRLDEDPAPVPVKPAWV